MQSCDPVESVENLHVYIFVYHLVTSHQILTIQPENKMADIQRLNAKGSK